MDKRSRIILFCLSLFGVISIILGCEKDDICADASITPFLIVRFRDFTNPDSSNDVLDLQIQYIPDEDEQNEDFDVNVFENAQTSDSIVLLLPTFKDTARFKFIQNYDLDEDENEDLSDAEIDIIEFTYTRSEEYVNRACGFRTVYSDLEATITPGDGETVTRGFIRSRNVINETIEDEDEAHIQFSH